MSNRIKIAQTQPAAVKAIAGLNVYLQSTSLTNTHHELIKIRSSQINGCAYCIDMHTKDARKYGETEQRIYLLNAWREVDFYTEEEKAILALTEEITLISNGGVTNETYQKAASLFDENYLSQIIMAIITINAWNRVAVTTEMKPQLSY
ncbi:carboxymuconolactone decarboxylase family protein [Flavobacterium sp. F-65]|uniref:Carboxymuconolactone decarboxylase family protein n=1 Tax=Flavobacterium pisciphilum TaxID=2893755 RepID=A0ABS8MQR2_9FLAO|nr:carboxymuconolactone decarboxylase family protein [Flavobacterium sp. F-65]MCC9071088.1 carboxymuconolactone decarboxylase family protein [Flavobacterium sp. F-65]